MNSINEKEMTAIVDLRSRSSSDIEIENVYGWYLDQDFVRLFDKKENLLSLLSKHDLVSITFK